jgi:hypothetical protein
MLSLLASAAAFAVMLAASLGINGCAADDPASTRPAPEVSSADLGSADEGAGPDGGADRDGRAGPDLPDASGASFSSVRANGSGCPAGTWSATIAPDGQSFAVRFDAYDATIEPGQAMQIRDCSLSINVSAPPGLSFAVSNFGFQGNVHLDEPGMTATETAKYYFQGNPLRALEERSDTQGPTYDSFFFANTVATEDLVWSPCGATRLLNAQTRVVLQNNPAHAGSGSMRVGDQDLRLRGNFKWKRC